MKKNWQFIAVVLVLSLAILACGSSTPAAPSDPNILFQDDFSSSNSGWDEVTVDGQGMTDYENGYYRILDEADEIYWANPGLSFTDMSLEVDATKAGGPDDNLFGVICRYQDENNFYLFLISSDGYYGIGKVTNGDLSLFGTDMYQPTDTINQGNATNRIKADCVGSNLTLTVNGQLVGSASDTAYGSGDIGLIAGASSTGGAGADIHFDNRVVRKP